VAAGEADGGFGLARYGSTGMLDPAFGVGGKVTTDVSAGEDGARGVAIQPDGKIVAVGHANFERFAVVRFNADGTPDATFGGDGIVKTGFTSGSDIAYALALQPNGKILAAGSASPSDGSAFALARYNPDGSLDTTFGGDGKVMTQFGALTGIAYGVALQANGKIVAAGEASSGGGFALVRYRTDGSLDPTFGGDGRVLTQFEDGFGGGARSVAIQADGRIVAAGTAIEIFGPFGLARYTRRGRLDRTFGGDGLVSVNMGDGEETARGVTVQTNGKIIAVGYSGVPHEGGDTGTGYFALTRLRTDGRLDLSFSGNGKVRTSFGARLALAMGVALEPGIIVVTGWAGDRFGLARYLR
jgi:uncharacterized delta-60 repeat protein